MIFGLTIYAWAQALHLTGVWGLYLLKGADWRDYGCLFLITCYAVLSLLVWNYFTEPIIFIVFFGLHLLGCSILWAISEKVWGNIVALLFLVMMAVDFVIVLMFAVYQPHVENWYPHVKGAMSHGMLLCAIFGRNRPTRIPAIGVGGIIRYFRNHGVRHDLEAAEVGQRDSRDLH